jgi:hypothetical protein
MADTSADNTPARVWVPILDYLHRDAEQLLATNPHPVPAPLCEKRTIQKIQNRKLLVRGRTVDGAVYAGEAHPSWGWRLNYAVIRDDAICDSIGVVLYAVEVCDPDKPQLAPIQPTPELEPTPAASPSAEVSQPEKEEALEPAPAPAASEPPKPLTGKKRRAWQLTRENFVDESLVGLSPRVVRHRVEISRSKWLPGELPSESTFARVLQIMIPPEGNSGAS